MEERPSRAGPSLVGPASPSGAEPGSTGTKRPARGKVLARLDRSGSHAAAHTTPPQPGRWTREPRRPRLRGRAGLGRAGTASQNPRGCVSVIRAVASPLLGIASPVPTLNVQPGGARRYPEVVGCAVGACRGAAQRAQSGPLTPLPGPAPASLALPRRARDRETQDAFYGCSDGPKLAA